MDNKSGPRSVEYLEISAARAGQRLDNFLIGYLHGVPRTLVYRILRTGQVRINKGRVKPSYRLQTGDMLRIPPVRINERTKLKASDLQPELDQLRKAVLLENEDFIVLNKPSGLAVHGGSGLRYGLIEVLKSDQSTNPELELVHRLDRETSGCLLLAKNRNCLQQLHALLREHQIQKRYITLLKGVLQTPLTIDSALVKRERGGERVVSVVENKSKRDKSACTYITPLRSFKGVTLADVEIDTGRTHQIRVHCASIGHPLAGDKKYGDREFNKQMRKHGLKRLFLHATGLKFKLGRSYNIHAELPEDLKLMLDIINE